MSKPHKLLLEKINRHGEQLKGLGDDELRRISDGLAHRDGDELLIEAYALVREAADRAIGMRPFDCQILAALALYYGNIVEMQTGEGKTLAAVLPTYVRALTGRGAHVVTFNDYLARRDARWMGPVYRYLGLSVGHVQEGMPATERRRAYAADVTYVTAKEAGFDFLRDGLAQDPTDLVQRPFHHALVDEADSLMIDEARIPLVLAGSTAPTGSAAQKMSGVVGELEHGPDYALDEYGRNVELTDRGLERVEKLIGCGSLVDSENLDLLADLNCALHAAVLLRRDVDYILRDGEVKLVDEFTGRVVEDRHWPDGLQAAIEAKEGVARRPDGRVLGSITLQHFLRLYPGLSGMTGTARPAADELREFYDLDVVVIPTNRPCIRKDEPDVVFADKESKHEALLEEIRQVHETGRPILVGTSSVEESENLAGALLDAGVIARVLNARTDEAEARIVADAGTIGALTISTNMAGRGTDIRLGGPREEDRDEVVALGGLYVIGTNRHESLRIDRQLRGRAGRQGDPGTSRFFVSLEDDLLGRFGIDRTIPPKRFRREIDRVQRIVEGQNFEIRRTLHDYSTQIDVQRKIVAAHRHDVLHQPVDDPTARTTRRLTLYHLDRLWSEHLAHVQDLRDGIHLVRVGGQDPLTVFMREAVAEFGELMPRVEEAVAESLQVNHEILRGPSSTWTYTVNDDPFRDRLEMQLLGAGSLGVGVGAALLTPAGPLLLAWGLYKRLTRERP